MQYRSTTCYIWFIPKSIQHYFVLGTNWIENFTKFRSWVLKIVRPQYLCCMHRGRQSHRRIGRHFVKTCFLYYLTTKTCRFYKNWNWKNTTNPNFHFVKKGKSKNIETNEFLIIFTLDFDWDSQRCYLIYFPGIGK